jgi:hypothetical protein
MAGAKAAAVATVAAAVPTVSTATVQPAVPHGRNGTPLII